MSNEKTIPPQGAQQQEAGQLDKAGSTAMVTVGCKLPNGLICELGKLGDSEHTVVRLNGANSVRVVGGFGLTPVAKNFWEAWVKKNKHLEFVRKGLVFAHNDVASASDHAQDRAEIRSGLEPLDPLKKLTDPKTGAVLLETDLNHFNQGRADVAQFGGGSRRAVG